jgi:hypothetical protein
MNISVPGSATGSKSASRRRHNVGKLPYGSACCQNTLSSMLRIVVFAFSPGAKQMDGSAYHTPQNVQSPRLKVAVQISNLPLFASAKKEGEISLFR